MKRCAIVWGIVVTLVAGTTVAAENPDLVVLENPSLRLDIGRAPVPHIERLVHKASGRQLVASSEESSIFSIVAHDAGGGRKTIDSALAGTSSIQVDTVGGRRRVVARYTDFPQSTLIGVVTITDDGAGALTRWSLQLEGIARERIETVRFPQLVSVPTLGDGSDDVLVLPALPGTLIENPAKNWRDGQRVTLSYPGSMSAQFVAYQDHEAGIYLAAMDSTGYPQSLSVSKRADAMVLWHEFHIVADANDEQGNNTQRDDEWKSPYDVAVGVTQGTWYDTADRYKQWAVEQPWCARTLTQRTDVPQWWKNGPAVHVLEARTYDSSRTCNGSYYPQLLKHLRTFREKIGGPVVPMLAGWENHRRWTAGDYFPIFDAESASGPDPVARGRFSSIRFPFRFVLHVSQ